MTTERRNAGNQPASPQTAAGRALPSTEAGRHYVAVAFGRESGNVTLTEAKMNAAVRKIEHGAADAALAGLREKAEAVIALVPLSTGLPRVQWQRNREAKARAAIADLRALIEGAHSVERAAEGEAG